MPLDAAICKQARLSRDPRFDGQFYTAVLTTGIYCRPTCPAGPAKEENVRYYQSAAHAEFNGYQPCKRCKPELAPGQKLPSQLELALNQLSYQPQMNVLQLAEFLKLSERQLQRLFKHSLGLGPKSFIDQQRQIKARQLLMSTKLACSDVAVISGFNSVRSFNEQLKSQYGLTPTKIRNSTKSPLVDRLSIKLNYQGELNWPLILAFFKSRLIADIETVTTTYQRTINLANCSGWLEVSKPDNGNYLSLQVCLSDYQALPQIITRVRNMFDLDCDLAVIRQHLGKDKRLTNAINHFVGLRLPGCWDIFEFSIRAILGQQISVKAATTLAGRIAHKFGSPLPANIASQVPSDLTLAFPEPQALLSADFSELGITNTRQQTLKTWIKFYNQNPDLFESPGSSEEFEKTLCTIKGIGPWTANYLAMRGLGLPDAFPAADLGIIKALAPINKNNSGNNNNNQRKLTSKEILATAEAWRPWRAYAAIYLWHSLALTT